MRCSISLHVNGDGWRIKHVHIRISAALLVGDKEHLLCSKYLVLLLAGEKEHVFWSW
jgi:hypothetical protein